MDNPETQAPLDRGAQNEDKHGTVEKKTEQMNNTDPYYKCNPSEYHNAKIL